MYMYIYLFFKTRLYTIYDFLIPANSAKVFGAFNKISSTKKLKCYQKPCHS